jgi:phospholipid/cholesterol/gamma-HCH transport system permease protein
VIQWVGRAAVRQWRDLQNVLAVTAAVGLLSVRPRHWPRTTRDVLARQILFTGVGATGLIVPVACIVGVSVVLQAQLWLGRVGQRAMVGPLLVVVIVREVAPVLANLVVILRSAGAVTAEMANMKLSGEVRLLDGQGLDPLLYLVMPRVVAMVVATLGLAIAFVVVSLVTGLLFGVATGAQGGPGEFVNGVLNSLGWVDVSNLLLKAVLPPAVTAVICCVEGLGVEGATTEVPRATSRGLERSVVALFVVAAAVSILTYL